MLQRWREFRSSVLRERPMCEPCFHNGEQRAATAIRHKEVHGGDPCRAFNPSLVEAVCEPHASGKRV
jgi:hypothetical protein